MRPWVTALTNGVFSQMPGSVGDPKVADVRPISAPALADTCVAACLSAAEVVSNWSTVRAVRGGGGGKVIAGMTVWGASGAATSASGRSHAARAKNGRIKNLFMIATYCAALSGATGLIRLAQNNAGA